MGTFPAFSFFRFWILRFWLFLGGLDFFWGPIFLEPAEPELLELDFETEPLELEPAISETEPNRTEPELSCHFPGKMAIWLSAASNPFN